MYGYYRKQNYQISMFLSYKVKQSQSQNRPSRDPSYISTYSYMKKSHFYIFLPQVAALSTLLLGHSGL